jgi:hypothetical protein
MDDTLLSTVFDTPVITLGHKALPEYQQCGNLEKNGLENDSVENHPAQNMHSCDEMVWL